MKIFLNTSVALFMIALAVRSALAEESWNQFRGSRGDGHSESPSLPLEWSEQKNIRWKTPISGKAWSSPVVHGGMIWLSNATEDGKKLSAVCIDAVSGKVKHDITIFEIAEPAFCHAYNSYASPTPVIEDDKVWMHFGSAGTACLDSKTGSTLWKRQDLKCDHHRGPGSSPILFEQFFIVNFDGFDLQYVIALDKNTGVTVWKTDRSINYGTNDGDAKKAYCTPTIFEHDGRTQLVSPAAVGTVAYDPRSGKELWKVEHGGYNAAARPIYSHGLVIIDVEGGQRMVAVKPDGSGDVTKTHIVWAFGKSTPTRPSQSVVGDHLYMVNDTGIMTCLHIVTGEPTWVERKSGRHSASLVEAGGRLYAFDEDGKCLIVEASPNEFRLIAENQLESGCMSSPAVIENDLIVRTKTHLYRIGE
jgi:outer membrane protein assembly factor BamB